MTAAVIGVDVGGTGTKAGVVTRAGEVLARIEHRTDPVAGTKGVLQIVEELLGRGPELGVEIVAVGVGAAGFIDAREGSVNFAPNLTYEDPQIARAVQKHVGLPVMVDNDANVAAWGERAFGAARGLDHVVCLTLGTGVGGGIIAGGSLIRGATGAGAELGHTVIVPDGPICGCGLRGCLEQLCSGQAIARMGREAVESQRDSSILDFAGSADRITAEHVASAAKAYDPAARDVLSAAGRFLGIGLSNFANLFDPEAFVLGGSVVKAGEPFLGPARDQLHEMTMAQRRRPVRVVLAQLGWDAGIIGAAALAMPEVAE